MRDYYNKKITIRLEDLNDLCFRAHSLGVNAGNPELDMSFEETEEMLD